MHDLDQHPRHTWLRFLVRSAWVACCVALLTTVTLIGSRYLSNRRLMVMTRPINPIDGDPVIGWEQPFQTGLDRWIGTEHELALFSRPVTFLIQGREISNAKILEVLQASSGLKRVSLHNRDVPQGVLAAIADRHSPEFIDFRAPVISPPDAALLSRMKSLKHVHIGQFERQSRQNDWSWLKNLPALETLDVTLWGASEADVIALAQCPAIRNVSLSGEGVTDATLVRFCHAPHLQALDLRLSATDDQSLAAIAALPKLHRISITESNITDTGLEVLARLPALTQLWLDSLPNLTDEGVKALAQSNSLTEIHIVRCGTTPNALIHLNAIPNWAEIRFEDVAFRRPVGGVKPVITPENAAETLERQREIDKMQNEVINGPIPPQLPE